MRPKNLLTLVVPLLAGAAILTACGGGGDDDAGSNTAFSIVPSSITVTGPAVGVCAVGTVGRVYVYGGAAPYRIDNTVPAYISVDRTTVANRGDYFTVTFLGGCLDPGNVVVVDSLDRQVTLTLTNEEGS